MSNLTETLFKALGYTIIHANISNKPQIMTNLQAADMQANMIEMAVKNWTKPTLTTLELKEYLRERFSAFFWGQEYVSSFMSQTDYPFTDNGTYRTYIMSKEPMYNSASKGLIPISSMDPKHARNAFLKHCPGWTVEDVLNEEGNTPWYLLKRAMDA